MPKLWTETVEAHRREVQDAILETTAALVAKHGVASVTMSQIAEATGIGRATLYKYFPDVEAILVAWHERHVKHHLGYLTEVRDRAGGPQERLEAVLEAYATIAYERSGQHGTEAHSRGHHATRPRSHDHRPGDRHARVHHGTEIAAIVHRTEHVRDVEQRLVTFLGDLLRDAARSGEVRDDVPPDELARYCLGALAGSGELSSKSAVSRLVAVTLAGLRPPKV